MSSCPSDEQSSSASAEEPPPVPFRRLYRRLPKILLMGDSLTQLSWEGWGAHLGEFMSCLCFTSIISSFKKRKLTPTSPFTFYCTCSFLANIYQRRADVLNRGYSGYNTRFFLRLLPDILRDEQIAPQKLQDSSSRSNSQQEEDEPTVALTILFFGANDAAISGLDDHHHVPVDEYQENLSKIIDIVKQETKCRRFLLVTPPPVHHEQRFAFQISKYGDKATGVLERTLENTGRYSQASKELATRLSYPCLDLYHDMQKDGDDWGRFLCDGLHFAKPGHDFVGHAMIQAINQGFGDDLRVVADPRTGQWCNSASTCPPALLLSKDGGRKVSGGGPYHDEIDATNPDQAFVDYNS